jgi:hypothetical protein
VNTGAGCWAIDKLFIKGSLIDDELKRKEFKGIRTKNGN